MQGTIVIGNAFDRTFHDRFSDASYLGLTCASHVVRAPHSPFIQVSVVRLKKAIPELPNKHSTSHSGVVFNYSVVTFKDSAQRPA